MPISQELANFRIDNAIDSTQLPDTVGLRYYNDGRDVLVDAIVSEKENYFYDEITTNLLSGVNNYKLPKRGDLDNLGNPLDGVYKIKDVSIKKKSTDTIYTELTPKSSETLENDLSYYEKGSDYFYILQGNHIFLYPTPTQNITDGLKITGIFLPKQLTLTDEETLPDNFKKAIFYYVAHRYFLSTRQFDEATAMLNLFNSETQRIITSISGRIQTPIGRELPNLNIYT